MDFSYSGYLDSSIGKARAFDELGNGFRHGVKRMMINLDGSGDAGRVAARMISPFVGLGTMVVSIVLRVCNIIEPIFTVFADMGASAIFLEPVGLCMIPVRVRHLGRNFYHQGQGMVSDLFHIGVIATFGGVVSPKDAYSGLTLGQAKSYHCFSSSGDVAEGSIEVFE